MKSEDIKKYKFDKYLNFFVQFPIQCVSEWKNTSSYFEHLKQNFNVSLNYCSSFLKNNENTGLNLEEHYMSILQVVELALHGFHARAYSKLNDVLAKSESFLETIFSSKRAFSMPGGAFYRVYKMRVDCPDVSHNDFFHIPFDKLHLTRNNRYSLQGIPCIYYGSTIYGCWEELDRPIIENTYIVRASLKLQFMDLSITPNYLTLDYDLPFLSTIPDDKIESHKRNSLFNFYQYLLMWPLIFASSVKVKFKKSIFRPEYLLPHLLLEWVKQNPAYDGIKYLSTKTSLLSPKSINQITNFYNCVVPVKDYKDNGYSEALSEKIRWSEPINYNVLKLLNALPIVEYKEFEVSNDFGFYRNFYKYESTIFWQLEKILLNMKDRTL